MHIAIHSLPQQYGHMRQPGLYWLLVNQALVADTLLLSTLHEQASDVSSICVLPDRPKDSWIDVLLAHKTNVRFYTLAEQNHERWLERLTEELEWYGRLAGRLIVVQYDVRQLDSLTEAALKKRLAHLAGWVRKHKATWLMIGVGDGVQQRTRLAPLSDELSGLGEMERHAFHVHYHIDHWRSGEGGVFHADFSLELSESGLRLANAADVEVSTSNRDDEVVLAWRECLAGRQAPSRHWQLFDSLKDLLNAAHGAHAATVVLGIATAGKVEELARQIHGLRAARGNRLKIVIREISQCLRHVDERLFFSAGTNLVVPYLNDVSRFFSQLQSVQGQIYRRTGDTDFDKLLQALRPQFMRGYVAAETFIGSVQAELERIVQDELPGMVLKLKPAHGLTALDLLAQCDMKRRGDFVTVVEQSLYLYLFACRLNDIEPALRNIFRVSVDTLASSVEIYDSAERLGLELSRMNALPAQHDYTDDLAFRLKGIAEPADIKDVSPESGEPQPVLRRVSLMVKRTATHER
ncbi:cellulose biosynthesis protein BcsE [Pseudomonas luteola]|uniref:cellulose biosynthesis protein BcsE n=1 Tax=Pseudomonas TaxID=286 RepID=UPI000F7732EE|nr:MULTISPECIES: cellulose biosynthesis protein BcsE [Pseudomonas]MBA1247830.1 cellulose biosynthesis protein BcsE [Pseudomonas zeshuii]QEU29344.1 cellulose biosynthesis protein BcsE [Pseudomonas luteola]RRW46220.1 cellulose biosynthesis protein BcsE [Pseudomonas luteola]